MGAVENVIVEPTLMEMRTKNYTYDRHGDISGWDEVQTFRIKTRNTRNVGVRVKIKHNFDTGYWDLPIVGIAEHTKLRTAIPSSIRSTCHHPRKKYLPTS